MKPPWASSWTSDKNMSLTQQITIWCDGCLEWEQRSATAKYARRELKIRGWTRVRENAEMKDYCPKCSAKRKR